MDLGNEKMRASTKVFVLLAGCALSGMAFAQCTNDAIFNAQSTPIHAFGNTCGKNPALTSFCSGTDIPNGAGTAVVQAGVEVRTGLETDTALAEHDVSRVLVAVRT